MTELHGEKAIAAVALALIGKGAALSRCESNWLRNIRPSRDHKLIAQVRKAILAGRDPLGDAFTSARPADVRREKGATYTPRAIIDAMVTWAARQDTPARIVDPGAGSGRFLLAAAKRFPKAQLVAVEVDPLAALILRANVAVRGLTKRTLVIVADYRGAALAHSEGVTLFIGNPPYVRHHDIESHWKIWFASTAAAYGIKASRLAGLHLHFFLRTFQFAKPGDYGAFITSAEWLDVNYGSTLRKLLADGLGGVALHILDPKAMPFADAITTGAITCFHVDRRPENLTVQMVESLDRLQDLSAGESIPWERVARSHRWSMIVRPGPAVPPGYVELGELCRVHRGQVTGSNDVWIAGPHTAGLPANVLIPTVTKAREILDAGNALASANRLRRVVDLPIDLDELDADYLPAISRFLQWAKQTGAHQSYTAQHRRAWWAVGLREPAPIVCTYMARRAPAFVRNLCKARHINIAHGLYPRDRMTGATLDALAAWLRGNVDRESGRTYAGGLTKFEPKELERVPIPPPENLPV